MISEITFQGVRHDDSCPKAPGCQEKDGRETEGMPILRRGDLPTLGTGSKVGERYMLSEGTCVALSLLPVWANLSELPGWDDQGGSDRAYAAICCDLLDIIDI